MIELRKIKSFGNVEQSYAEYVKSSVLANGGTQSIYLRSDLMKLCDERQIEYSAKDGKEVLYEKLIEAGFTPLDFERNAPSRTETCGIGVSVTQYKEAFEIDDKQWKRLEKSGLLVVVGKYRTRMYGKYVYPKLYSAYQFVTITVSEMADYLANNKPR